MHETHKHTQKPCAMYCNSRQLIANLCEGSQHQSLTEVSERGVGWY